MAKLWVSAHREIIIGGTLKLFVFFTASGLRWHLALSGKREPEPRGIPSLVIHCSTKTTFFPVLLAMTGSPVLTTFKEAARQWKRPALINLAKVGRHAGGVDRRHAASIPYGRWWYTALTYRHAGHRHPSSMRVRLIVPVFRQAEKFESATASPSIAAAGSRRARPP